MKKLFSILAISLVLMSSCTRIGVGYVGYSTARTVDKWKSNVN